jgi:ketosteroid isomerase-like protein
MACLPARAATPAETVAEFHQALKAGDKARAAALLKPEIHIFESGQVERSRDEYAAHHLGADMEFARATDSKVLRHSERIDGNLAVVMQETETTGKFQGRPVHLFGTETAILEKQGDGWVVTHIHWSSRQAAR